MHLITRLSCASGVYLDQKQSPEVEGLVRGIKALGRLCLLSRKGHVSASMREELVPSSRPFEERICDRRDVVGRLMMAAEVVPRYQRLSRRRRGLISVLWDEYGGLGLFRICIFILMYRQRNTCCSALKKWIEDALFGARMATMHS